MRVIVSYNLQYFPLEPNPLAVSYESQTFGGTIGFGAFLYLPLDVTAREIEKAIVDDIVAFAATEGVVVRPRDILLPVLTQG